MTPVSVVRGFDYGIIGVSGIPKLKCRGCEESLHTGLFTVYDYVSLLQVSFSCTAAYQPLQ